MWRTYDNYFARVEEHFHRRRGGQVRLLSATEWAMIETWKESGVPLGAVFQGIDFALRTHGQLPPGSMRVNSLAYCEQAVLAVAERMKKLPTEPCR